MLSLGRPAYLLAIVALVCSGAGAALGFWTGGPGELLRGSGAGAATSVNPGSTPTVAAAGTSGVLVSWSPSTMANVGAVDGYLVKRYDANTDAAQTVLAGCAGTVTATSCTETGLPVGDWKAPVTPTVGSNWRGTESAKSATISTTTIDFLQPVTSPEQVRSGPAGSDVGDVDNDGDPDVVTSSLYQTISSVLVNNGVGDFTERTVASNIASVDAGLGKFDNDANLDLVILYQGTPPGTGLVAIFKGGGDGNFTFAGAGNQVINTGVRSSRLVVGNFNGDAIDDVAVLNQQNTPSTTAGTVTTYLGNPAGTDTFSSASPAQTLTTQLGSSDLEFADFNGGAGDIVVANEVSNSISFIAGNGTGFNAPVHAAAGARVYFLDSANVNSGANRDLVATIRYSSPSAVRTLLGDGAGGFPTQVTTAAASAGGGEPQGLVADDLDNDGDQDVGVANGNPGSVSVLDNDGTGAFSPVASSPETGIGAVATYPFEILAADFDGSGYKDLAVGNLFTVPGENRALLNQSGTKANLSISQSDSPDPVNAGSTLTYTLTVANAGPGTPSVVKASDTLPTGVSFNAAASSPTCSASGTATVTVTCDYGSVVSGTPESQQVAVTVGATGATISNTATVGGNLADPTPANNTSAGTTTVNLDTQAPTHALSLDSANGAFLSGSTLYYKGNAAGSFKLVDALADSGSGPASVTYPSIATTGWTHPAETVTTPTGGPYTSTTYSWTANPTNPASHSVSGKDVSNNTSSNPLTFVSDTTAPATGSVSYTNGMVYTESVPVTTANGTDGGSGIDASSGTVKRAQATLNTGTQTCGSFGGFTTTVTLVGGADTSVTSGNCYQYQYLVSDRVGNQATYSSASVAKVDTTSYTNTVLADSGLVNYWRLGESGGGSTFSNDTMTGSAGTTLQAHTGETGATWTKHIGSDSVLTDANRLRKNTTTSRSAYYASGVPPSANYSVEADVHVKSIISNDAIGVVGRQDTSNALGTFYFANYETSDQSWNLGKYVNGTRTYLNFVTGQALTAGQTYNLELVMSGSSLSVYVNDVLKASATDTSIAAAGRAGVRLGQDGSFVNTTNTTGLHLDNFSASGTGAATATDSKGTNHGTYVNSPTLGAPGAISSDANTAVSFDGVDDHVTAARQISDNFSIEFWFKSTQGLGTNAQWWGNAGLVDAEVGGAANDFGSSLRSDGRVVAGIGTPDVSVVSTSGGYNNGAWHHVVFTRTRLTGALALYIDGAPAGTASGASTALLTSPPSISLGRIATGGNYLAGTLDEVALYSTVLSQATAADHYARR